MTRIWLASLLLGGAVVPATADDVAGEAFFREKVRPLLEARCYKCHGPASKAKGGLRLDSRESALKGGDTGPALVAGDPEASLLIKAVRAADPDAQMPPKEKLPAGEVAILEQWVKSGAAWSADAGTPARKEKPITAEDRAWWAFQPVLDVAPPDVGDAWAATAVDRFILARLKAEGLTPAPEADRATLIRRATFDLHGLPPTPEEIDAFVKDASPGAWERLIDRLLASPRYGERMARRWLDVVRYAESDGWRQDAYRPHTWPYRDWVIRAFNEDKPYDRFVLEQLAGDEAAPDDPDARVATGFLRLGIYEYNQRDAETQWRDILNEVTDVTADAFLGLGMGCARCHDHKFDPILQTDYFKLQSFFAALRWRDDLPWATAEEIRAHDAKRRVWEEKTAEVRAKIAELERPYVEKADENIVIKFLPELVEVWRNPKTPYQRQIADLVHRQILWERSLIDGKIKGAAREKWSALKRQLAEHAALLPRDLPTTLAVTDVGPEAPPTKVPPTGPVVEPGFPIVLGGEKAAPKATETSTGRRSALARWITRADHPLTPRVLVNRLWQQHFGRGLVGTASDFGRLGEKPTHPELLDWLARELVRSGWSVKAMHRRMMLTATYRQSSVHPDAARARLKDPEARLLWRMPLRRLEAEEVRDAMLAVCGELDLAEGGPSVDPNQPRRTVYTKALRNTRDPVLDAFDPPDAFASVAQRNTTTTATQALLLINGRWPLERASALARRLKGRPTAEQVDLAWRLATGRPPTASERAAATAFLARGGHVAARPTDMPLVQAMPDRGGQAARIRGAEVLDRLKLPSSSPMSDADFTVEAVVVLDSLHEDAAVRTIASQWNGNPKSPGWSLGVTSEKSKHLPRNLILQLVGDQGYEVVASDLRLDLHRTHYVAVSVRLEDTGAKGITFYLQDLSDPEAPLRMANVRHAVTAGVRPTASVVIGGRDGPAGHGWDGLIDEIRISRAALAKEQLVLFDGAPPARAVAAHWRFEVEPGFFKDSAGVQPPLTRPSAPAASAVPAASEASLVDFCHALLNSNGFLYVD